MNLSEFDDRNCLQAAVGNDGIAAAALYERPAADLVHAFRRYALMGRKGYSKDLLKAAAR